MEIALIVSVVAVVIATFLFGYDVGKSKGREQEIIDRAIKDRDKDRQAIETEVDYSRIGDMWLRWAEIRYMANHCNYCDREYQKGDKSCRGCGAKRYA